ncbi:MAG: Peptidoglycan glycosyltransferase [Thermoleophilia bacterium]|nr:Peptidoglycan glycosyltransferase [Thermoleophilia bacterium]
MGTKSPTPNALDLTIPRRRLALLLVGLLLLLLLVASRTVWLQSVKNRTLTKYATTQQQNTQELPAVRGAIVDRNGDTLAIGEEAVTFFGDPRLIKQRDRISTAQQVSDILGFTKPQREQLVTRLEDAKGGFVYIARQVPQEQAKLLIAAKIPGIGHYDEEKRMYPARTVAGQLIGAVDTDGRGIDGMELLYNNSLTGTPGQQVSVRDPAGVPIDVRKLVRERDGKPVQLTIDSVIQENTERVLAATVKRFSAESGQAIVMNPTTGEIYAMANVPLVDPGKWSTATGNQKRLAAVTDIYEPGSTFKIVTISGALEDKVVQRDTEQYVPIKRTFCKEKDTCSVEDAEERAGPEYMSTEKILVESSNLGTIAIAERLTAKRFDQWITKFGFGARTGIDFPGEGLGLRTPLKLWSDVSIGNIPIGQGISVTPIQIASAYATIANGGVRVQPHLLEKVGDEPAAKPQARRVLSEKTAAIMRSMFGGVVRNERGTGNAAQIDGYEVGGKTGTANVADANGYNKQDYVASFVGFVPAKNPKLVTLVVVRKPRGSIFGGAVAAPAFEQITKFALVRLNIAPDGLS